MRAGLTVDQFWSMTPKETHLYLEAATWKEKQKQRSRAWLAWHIAAFTRAKKMPAYAAVVKPKEARVLTAEEKKRKQAEFEELVKRIEHGKNSDIG